MLHIPIYEMFLGVLSVITRAPLYISLICFGGAALTLMVVWWKEMQLRQWDKPVDGG